MRRHAQRTPIRFILLLAAMAYPAPLTAQDAEPVEPPRRVAARPAQELIRGEWSGTTVNQNDTSRTSTLTLASGDFSQAAGRFSNWKIIGSRAEGGRRGTLVVTLLAPGTQDGQPVEKPITCVGRFNEGYTRWTGEFQGFRQTGVFELQRQTVLPDADAVRGKWIGELIPRRSRDGETPPPFKLNLLTGNFDQATGIVFLSPQHPGASSFEVTYHNPATREVDFIITFDRPEDRRAKAARSAEFQGVFNADFTVLEGAFKAVGLGNSGSFRLEKNAP